MAELLIKAQTSSVATSPWQWLAGHPVVVMDDGHQWGAEEGLPKFVLLKIPGVPVAKVLRYLSQFTDQELMQANPGEPQRRRVWQVQLSTLPAAARTKLKGQGFLTIMVAAFGYTGAYDYTWAQVRNYFLNTVNGTTETGDIS